MKPPTIDELRRIAGRFDPFLIEGGYELHEPLALSRNYAIGGEHVKADELVRRLVRRCLELEDFIGRDEGVECDEVVE
jgi:hypothetical protein